MNLPTAVWPHAGRQHHRGLSMDLVDEGAGRSGNLPWAWKEPTLASGSSRSRPDLGRSPTIPPARASLRMPTSWWVSVAQQVVSARDRWNIVADGPTDPRHARGRPPGDRCATGSATTRRVRSAMVMGGW